MQPVWRARAAASALAAVAVALAVLGRWASAAALGTAAVAVLLLVTSANAPVALASGAAWGATESLARMARGLNLAGRGILVPPRSGLARVRLFVPAEDVAADALPPLEADVVVHRGPPGAVGLSVPPPGAGLEAAWAAFNGLPKGLERVEAATHVARALGTYGLGRDVEVSAAGGRVRVAYRPMALRELCRATRIDWAPWGVQGGCPACSLAGILVARAYHGPVRLASAEEDAHGRVVLEWEVLRSGRT